MARIRGTQCRVFGCSKRKRLGEHKERSDSEGTCDESQRLKENFPGHFISKFNST